MCRCPDEPSPRLSTVREERGHHVDPDRLVVEQQGHDLHIWTWAGLKANETLRAALGSPEGRSENDLLVLRSAPDLGTLTETTLHDAVPSVHPDMVDALKFSAALPQHLAIRTLGERLADRSGARAVAAQPRLRRPSEAR